MTSRELPPKTNAVRLLDAAAIPYRLVPYEVDPDDLSAETVAAKVGLPPEQVFKTLLVRGDVHGLAFALVAADSELDLKALARATGDRKVDTVGLKELQPLTGYIRGGVTVLAAKKAFPVVIDELFELFDEVSVSAGMRGLQVLLAPADFIRLLTPKLAAISKPKA